MIELLGVGVQAARGEWLLRRVCARLERGTVSAVVARAPRESTALIDAVTGRRVPLEGRVWVDRVPLMRETTRRVRALVREAAADAPFAAHRSLLWNTLTTPGTVLPGLLRFPRRAERQAALHALDVLGLADRARDPVVALSSAERARLAVARALARRPTALVLRDLDAILGPDGTARLLDTVRGLARSERVIAIVSLQSIPLARAHTDRVLVLTEGRLVGDTPAWKLDAPVTHQASVAR